MVERINELARHTSLGEAGRLDAVFGALSDPTRRDILKRLGKRGMSVGEIATHYRLTFAAVAKHLDVLARSGLVTKTRKGKEQIVSVAPKTLAAASNYLDGYKQLWEERLDLLDNYLKLISKPHHR